MMKEQIGIAIKQGRLFNRSQTGFKPCRCFLILPPRFLVFKKLAVFREYSHKFYVYRPNPTGQPTVWFSHLAPKLLQYHIEFAVLVLLQ